MEKEIKKTQNNKDNIVYDKEEKNMKNENDYLNEFHFSFENKNEINDTNYFSNIILENENVNVNINIKDNQNNDSDEDNEEENTVFNAILEDLNKNIEINVKEIENENKNYKECQEILAILKYPLNGKNIGERFSPFIPRLKPTKISLIGKVLVNVNNNDCNNKTENCMSICNNN